MTTCKNCGLDIDEEHRKAINYLLQKSKEFEKVGLKKEADGFRTQATNLRNWGTMNYHPFFTKRICGCTKPDPKGE